MEFLRGLLGNSAFMPHGHCYLWDPQLLWLQVLSNSFIAVAYFAISAMLFYLVRKGDYVPFKGMAVAFGVFIVSCGLTHLMDVIVIWEPFYWLDGTVRGVTAVASVATAILLPPLIPRAISLAHGARRMRDRGMQMQEALDEMELLVERTRELDRLKTNFFANVSHELRTPLALVLAPTEKLLTASNLDAGQRGDLETIQRNARFVLKHVNDLLELSRVEAGRAAPSYRRCDVGALVARFSANFDGLAKERDTEYVIDTTSVTADIDVDMFERILLNLLSNAFKFSPMSGGVVRCSLSEVGTDVVLEVADDGPGIAVEYRDVVFERFRQGVEDASERSFGGTGLGLAITRDFVELHGGTVVVGEAPEGGALFRICVPKRAPDGVPVVDEVERAHDAELHNAVRQSLDELGEPPRRKLTPARGGRPVALVAEDNVELNEFVCSILEERYDVIPAFDGQEALESTLKTRPDIVVSDVMMPSMGGARLVKEIREHEELDATPILVLTARADDPLKLELLREGAQDYVMKPFSNAELLARVDNLVAVKRARDVLQREVSSKQNNIEELAGRLSQQKRELERALDSMRLARESAENASQMKTSFLSLVSHELRSPVAALQLQTRRLELETKGEGGGIADLVERMTATTRRLQRLIDGLLHYSRIQSGKLTLRTQQVVVEEFLDSTLPELRTAAEARGLELARGERLSPEVAIETDPTILGLVLVNLVENAIKYTDEGSVTVGASRDERGVTFTVRDTGRGIPPTKFTSIFEPFHQLEATRKKHQPGVGLGLALVKELVSGVGGTIVLDSEEGVGSTFAVTIPGPGE